MIIFRLGSVAVSQDSKLTRITRSQVEVKDDNSNRHLEGEHNRGKMDSKVEPKTGKKEEKANSEVTPNLNRPVRLVRQKVIGKKVVVKKVVRVTREGKYCNDHYFLTWQIILYAIWMHYHVGFTVIFIVLSLLPHSQLQESRMWMPVAVQNPLPHLRVSPCHLSLQSRFPLPRDYAEVP